MYRVFRLFDDEKTDHSGGREYFGSCVESKVEAMELAKEKNRVEDKEDVDV